VPSPFSDLRSDRVGVFAKELPVAAAASAFDAIDATRAAGLSASFFSSPMTASARLDPGELQDVAAYARDSGIVLRAGVGSLNPLRAERSVETLAAGDGDLLTGFVRLLEACAALGVDAPMVVIGIEADRFDADIPWSQHLAAATAFFKQVAARAVDLGLTLVLKTHQELTSWEARRVIEAVGIERMRVALDPVNLIVRMEDPLSAASRLAGIISQVHIDDALLPEYADGLRRQSVPVGDGLIDWSDLVTAISASDPDAFWWGEAHQAELARPFRSDGWFTRHPDIDLREFARWIEAGVNSGRGSTWVTTDSAAQDAAALIPTRRQRILEVLGQ
jgi:sugar phosphate isomerase/epimerase